MTEKSPAHRHPPGIVMADEHTPLIATVLVAEPRQRYQHHYVRRLCTTAICACLFAFFTTFVVLVCLDPDDGSSYFPGPPSGPAHSTAQTGPNFSHQDLLDVLFETPSAEKAEDWSRYYTAGPHLAGQNFSQVRYPLDCLGEIVLTNRLGEMDSGEVD